LSRLEQVVFLREPVANKANIFQINQVIRMINLKVNEIKLIQIPLSNFFLSLIVKDDIIIEMSK
jgi:hypothetical protein